MAIFVSIPSSVIHAEPVLSAQAEASLTPTAAPTSQASMITTVADVVVPANIAPPVGELSTPIASSTPVISSTPQAAPVLAEGSALSSTPVWEPVPFDTCMKLALPPCLNQETTQLPPAPAGYAWKRLEGAYTFSAYAHPTEDYFLGDQVDIPGIQNLTAKEGFLYGVDGIGMQGGGYIWRKNAKNELLPTYIRYIAGTWKLDGQDVVISDQWRYKDSGVSVDPQLIGKIRLDGARFAMVDEPDLTPYYSVAASPRFPMGTKLYVPGLSQFGGAFEVQDRGGAFGPDSQRFDLYVGKEMDAALQFIRLDALRSNLTVYALEPE